MLLGLYCYVHVLDDKLAATSADVAGDCAKPSAASSKIRKQEGDDHWTLRESMLVFVPVVWAGICCHLGTCTWHLFAPKASI